LGIAAREHNESDSLDSMAFLNGHFVDVGKYAADVDVPLVHLILEQLVEGA